mmetsp:Transcript_125994/g.251469  ORF Transcript_125994/g.251469 Transcript_125994/m.251469 type:complete len:955 (+) Transcript_125994:32-2896(+)|eukprot:CAMPEP_0172921506 /NCGR_PEP_ID=MMETSP1075-20121228/206022_1 /TAXON_ID=2916 /ORGANISM="Ceratium fusus, Strain PA161109" /LENGTH=954 /DNA_ID=CAMNT_0013781677 /DNA_START=27 /DNA_END=2891 /DNA_ORIENTATION=+
MRKVDMQYRPAREPFGVVQKALRSPLQLWRQSASFSSGKIKLLDTELVSQTSSRNSELRYTKFSIGPVGPKHAVFVQDNQKLTPSILRRICKALDVEVPRALLCSVTSDPDPRSMFEQLVGQSKVELGAPSHQPAQRESSFFDTPGCTRRDTMPDLLISQDEALEVFQKKIASTVGSIANAASNTNIWFCSGPDNTTFEASLEQAFDGTKREVFRVSIVHMQDKGLTGRRTLMRQLLDNSQFMSNEVVAGFVPVTLQGDNRVASKSTLGTNDGFRNVADFDDEPSSSNSQSGWPTSDLIICFYRESSAAKNPSLLEMDSDFTTDGRLSPASAACSMGTVGHVIMGGSIAEARRTLLQALRVMSPVIILDNTLSVPTQLALFVGVVQRVWSDTPLTSCRQFFNDGDTFGTNWPSATELLDAMQASKVLGYIQKGFAAAAGPKLVSPVTPVDRSDKRLALSDVVAFLEMVKRRPQFFKEMVAVVDFLRDEPEKAASKSAALFNNPQLGLLVSEFNSTQAHRQLVFRAWRLHRTFTKQALRLQRLANTMVLATSSTMVLSTAIAVCLVAVRLQEAKSPEDARVYTIGSPMQNRYVRDVYIAWNVGEETQTLRLLMLLLPGIFLTLQGCLQPGQKWAAMHMAACQTVAQIHCFLSSTGIYSKRSVLKNKKLMHQLNETARSVSGSRYHNDLHDDQNVGSPNDFFPTDTADLEQYVNEHLYGIRPRSWFQNCLQACVMRLWRCGSCCNWTALLVDTHEEVDFAAVTTAELYLELRVLPLRKYYHEWLRRLFVWRIILLMSAALCLVCTALLGAYGGSLSVWIPALLSLAAAIMNATSWFTPSSLMEALENAITTLTDLELRYNGSERGDAYLESTKSRLVLTTERLSLSVSSTYAGSPVIDRLEDIFDSDGVYGSAMPDQFFLPNRGMARKNNTRDSRDSRDTTSVTDTQSGSETPNGV